MAEEHKIPLETPPVTFTSDVEESQPDESLSLEGMQSSEKSEMASPQELPPESVMAESSDFAAGAWFNNRKITALWTINQTRNAWARVSGMGWKRINNSNNSSTVALTILAAHARDRNRNVKVNIKNNKIVEMYVW